MGWRNWGLRGKWAGQRHAVAQRLSLWRWESESPKELIQLDAFQLECLANVRDTRGARLATEARGELIRYDGEAIANRQGYNPRIRWFAFDIFSHKVRKLLRNLSDSCGQAGNPRNDEILYGRQFGVRARAVPF